ncbi:class II fumarate hydratase [Gilvimarinus sp. SDUM040013]|uniref:Class II fumarate hydratase n=1 Tax=Gilvimarinus gilvus TaxID=3058038 RepID=A0ABU4S0E2_9GAMM|nr:class II fumarate hydratase [Gilvimarinus sp. SDUM040013]MDO3385670.1 class II fumarate hydratase [Gilvimarinus sp. SDUM040013]MDX6849308.1 class II fumarate hydratase [Gilvimarinus sp. SDUM040013]
MTKTRIERDSMGELEVASGALYGAQTQRAINNFPISGQTLPRPFIEAVLLIKAASAKTNAELGVLDGKLGAQIAKHALQLIESADLMQHFPVDVYQTGSGTSTNMNANEVLAHLASQSLAQKVSPNDHVNCSQSSNDVIPTAIHISTALTLDKQLIPALHHLKEACERKARSVRHIVKTGRTHLMDAMPVRMSQTLNAWASQIDALIVALAAQQSALRQLAQGGTAVGTGVNTPEHFSSHFCKHLNTLTGDNFIPGDNLFRLISTQDTSVAVSGALKAIAVSLTKIANDLRWMNSGPLAGLGEIELEALQPGSSIMPGKVNPVIPEAVVMVAADVIGKDTAITLAAQSGNFELNVCLPVIANNLLVSIHILSTSLTLLADKAVATFKVREANIAAPLARNPILVTALNEAVGYLKAAEIAKEAYRSGRPILDVAQELTDISRSELEVLLDPATLAGDT